MHPDENIPALVSEETWERANQILAKRSADVKSHRGQYTHANLLSCKMYCAHCGAVYHRQTSTAYHSKAPNSSWVCSGKKKRGTHTCPSRYIWESEMKDVLFTLFKGFHESREEMAQRILQSLEQIQPKTSIARDMEKVQEAIDKLKARRERLLDLNVSGILSNEDFAGMIRECGQQLEQQNELMKKLQAKQDQAIDIHKRLQTIQAAFATFDRLATPEDITPALVDAVISRIDVSVQEEAIHLDFHLADGTSLAQQLTAKAHTRGRPKNSSAGHSRKRLIEQAERGMANQ